MDQPLPIESELARIRTLLEVLIEDTHEMKSRVGEIAELDKRLAEMQVRQDALADSSRYLQQQITDLQTSKESVESFVDKVKGAFILIGFLQAAIVGGSTWIVTQVVDTRQDVAVLQYSLDKYPREQGYRVAPIEAPSNR